MPRLYLITDRARKKGRSLPEVVKSALDGGVRFVQLREKDLSGLELFRVATELRELTKKYDAKLLINDRVDIAMAVEADGVHLGGHSISVRDARKAFSLSLVNRHSSLVGVSAHSLEEAIQAESEGADFITFGPVYFTPSKAAYGQPLGIKNLKKVAKTVNIPLFALGGIKDVNVEEVLSAGAYGVAMISAIMAADDIKKAAGDILMKIARAGHKA